MAIMKNTTLGKLFNVVFGVLSVFLGLGVLLFYTPTPAYAACVATAPGNLTAAGSGSSQVMLSWSPATNVSRYALVYGLSSGNYQFGALSVDGGSQTNYTVTHLTPGVRYYFQIWSFCEDSGPATPSNEVSIVAPR